MVNIFKGEVAAKNAKSPDVKIGDRLYFEFHKKVFNTSGIKLLETVISRCALSLLDGMDIFVA